MGFFAKRDVTVKIFLDGLFFVFVNKKDCLFYLIITLFCIISHVNRALYFRIRMFQNIRIINFILFYVLHILMLRCS